MGHRQWGTDPADNDIAGKMTTSLSLSTLLQVRSYCSVDGFLEEGNFGCKPFIMKAYRQETQIQTGGNTFTFTFTFSHLSDAFIQSNVQRREQSGYEQ